MDLAVDISTVLEDIRSDLEDKTGYPTYSERLPETTEVIDILVYIDDAQPWALSGKNLSLNLVLSVRGRMTDTSSASIESHIQDIALDVLRLYSVGDSTFEFPGAHADFIRVGGGYELDSKGVKTERYVMNQYFRLI